MVVVADGDSHGCLFRSVFADGGAGFQTDIFEFAIALILVEEFRRRVVGDIDVGPAGVVEVGPDHAQSVIAIGIV